jgi:hypothetical protein
MICPAFTHQHPALTLSLSTRTRIFGTLNVALALRGKSCGWGTCERPRRTFVGHHRINTKAGRYFVELQLIEGSGVEHIRFSRRISLGAAS